MAEGFSGGPIDEFELKGRYWNSETVNARLAETFSGTDRSRAAIALAALVGDVPDGDPEASDLATCRLMLAALKVSDGDLLKLGMWIDAAHNDPRDLMAAAEYRRELQGEGDDAREADLAEYVAWVSGFSAGDGI